MGSNAQLHRLKVYLLQMVMAVSLAAIVGGCAQQPAAPTQSTGVTPWTSATSTMQWNDFACELIARNQVGQFPALRTLAYMNLAIHNAIIEARRKGLPPDGAAAGAAAFVLAQLFPKEEQAIATRLAGEAAAVGAPGRAPFTAGIETGRAAATDVMTLAKSDRADAAWSGTVPTGDDKWSSRLQPPRPPIGPHFGQIRPFFLTSAADFRAAPPPPMDTAEFRANVREVRQVSDARTNEQIRIAQYWEGLTGSFNAGAWNGVARRAIAQHGLSEPDSARVLAMMHMAGLDANLACHDSKYVYWVPRPTQVDPQITLAIGVPNHPSYPSNHACISGAMGRVLDSWFPDQRGLYWAMAREAGESRIYGGIHYRIDLDAGYKIADKVAQRAIEVGVAPDKVFTPLGR
jgi:hypothetical protein